MQRRRIAAALASALIVGLIAISSAPAQAQAYSVKTEEYIVKTRHGKIFVEVMRPVQGDKDVKAPAIFTYTPYAVLGRNSGGAGWVSQGYARITADVVGTGNSGGCYDYGGIREKESAYDLVEWIAKQKWSTGKVAMYGGSYEGTTATAAAVMNPPHLTTIVPIAGISRWYEYAYSGGIRYFWTNEAAGNQGAGSAADEGFDTPLAFDFGFAIPPPTDVSNPDWAERVQSTITPCEELEHTLAGYDFDTPDYDKFWLERDYIVDADKIDIPVLIGHNWGDWNVKQEGGFNLFHALTNSPKKVMVMGTRYEGHGAPGGDWSKIVQSWFEHYLKGVDNGADKLPSVVSQTSDSDAAGKWFSGAPRTKNVTLIAQEAPRTDPDDYAWQLLPTKPQTGLGPGSVAQFPSTGVNTEMHANHHARNNHDWYWFETPVLAQDTRIFGNIKVQIYSTVDREWITFTPTIVDVNPECHLTVGNQHVMDPACAPEDLISVTRGWLDSRYRKTLAKQSMLKPGEPFGMTVVTKPQDYTFKKGHYIGLNIQTEINEWSIPKIYPCATPDCPFVRINWEEGKTRLILPVVGAPADPADLFEHQHQH